MTLNSYQEFGALISHVWAKIPQAVMGRCSCSQRTSIIFLALRNAQKRIYLPIHLPLSSRTAAPPAPFSPSFTSNSRLGVQRFDQSRSSDDRWTKWLDPIVNVVYALFATLGEGVGLVNLRTWTYLSSAISHYSAGVLTRESDLRRKHQWHIFIFRMSTSKARMAYFLPSSIIYTESHLVTRWDLVYIMLQSEE
jgi:hypothetical protein